MKPAFSLIAMAGFSLFWSEAAQACSAQTPCLVEDGEYFLALPEGDEPAKAAVIFLHGAGSSGAATLRNTGMTSAFLERGYAVIAPSGTTREGRAGRSWSFHPEREARRDEIAFLSAVRDEALTSLGLDKENIFLAGFSVGGSMTSYLACTSPDSFKAYAPVAGSFWRPHPESCEGPVQLLHTHGWTDGTVPLEGRVLRGGDIRDDAAFAQGDVFHAMDIWRETNECFQLKADNFNTAGYFWRRKWERCAPDTALELALFPAGHIVPNGWAEMAIEWFEAL
jgi:polyhydroxybutyrate depolymerase